MRRHILAYDVGTSGVKAAVTDLAGRVIDSRYGRYALMTRPAGWIDQDLDSIMAAIAKATGELLADGRVDAKQIDGIGVTGQMFNVVPMDAEGVPLLPMLSWLDLRAKAQAEALSARLGPSDQFRLLGSIVTAKDVIPKILWLRDEQPEVWRRTVWLLDCKDAVAMRLTGTAATDYSTATSDRLLDPTTRQWNREACAILGVPVGRLPPVHPAPSIGGWLTRPAADRLGLIAGTPVMIGGGDVPATQVGSGAVNLGDTHLSIGTAAYWGVTCAEPGRDPSERLGSLAHMDPSLWILWLEIATAGAALDWILRLFTDGSRPDHSEVDQLVRDALVDDNAPLFTPWLTGERAPLFDDEARAAFVGLRADHDKGHLLRAVMEGVAFQIRWAFDYALAFGQPVGPIRTVGGGSMSDVWLQMIADILGRPILCVEDAADAGARGAAQNVLVGLGVEPDFGFAGRDATIGRTVEPDLAFGNRLMPRYERYRRLYDALGTLRVGGDG